MRFERFSSSEKVPLGYKSVHVRCLFMKKFKNPPCNHFFAACHRIEELKGTERHPTWSPSASGRAPLRTSKMTLEAQKTSPDPRTHFYLFMDPHRKLPLRTFWLHFWLVPSSFQQRFCLDLPPFFHPLNSTLSQKTRRTSCLRGPRPSGKMRRQSVAKPT